MWCTRDAVDVTDASTLVDDPTWGWVHDRHGNFHTLAGTPLTRSGSTFTLDASATPNVPILPEVAPDQW